MEDSKVSALDTLASVDRTTDLLYVVDASGPTSNKITINSALGFSGGNPVSTSDSQTLTNKTIGITNTITQSDALFTLQDNSDNTKQAQFQLSGITTGTTRTYTLPNASSTLVDLSTSQTLTNKTLTSPTINTATISNPTLTVDTVSEFTPANGVNVDGLLIKDGLLPAGNIQPLNLLSGTGSTWVWQTWAPTFTNVSGGSLVYAKYIQMGKTVHVRLLYTLAGAGVSGAIIFSLPVSCNPQYTTANLFEGTAWFRDTGTAVYSGVPVWASASTVELQVVNSSATYASLANASSTVPHTWANTDQLGASFSYEAA